mmetsp:Transcript_100763/g.270653  ORF Transcript_100763/g.270653 Transcript_100763/m.270653 type:complete len:238 (-) Transcript_100763:79-792(-)
MTIPRTHGVMRQVRATTLRARVFRDSNQSAHVAKRVRGRMCPSTSRTQHATYAFTCKVPVLKGQRAAHMPRIIEVYIQSTARCAILSRCAGATHAVVVMSLNELCIMEFAWKRNLSGPSKGVEASAAIQKAAMAFPTVLPSCAQTTRPGSMAAASFTIVPMAGATTLPRQTPKLMTQGRAMPSKTNQLGRAILSFPLRRTAPCRRKMIGKGRNTAKRMKTMTSLLLNACSYHPIKEP